MCSNQCIMQLMSKFQTIAPLVRNKNFSIRLQQSKVLQNEFSNEEKITIYKIAYSNIKDTKLGTKVKYYPSFLIYNKGKLISYLKSNKDEDTLCYTSKEEFKKWFTKYVKLKS